MQGLGVEWRFGRRLPAHRCLGVADFKLGHRNEARRRHVGNGEKEPRQRVERDAVAEQRFATSHDGTRVPYFLVHLDHGVTNLKLEVFDVATGKSFNFADDENWVARNSTATAFFAIPWDGTTVKRPNGRAKAVPNGTYRVELSVLKALGDPRNPAHLEKKTLPNVVIARP